MPRSNAKFQQRTNERLRSIRQADFAERQYFRIQKRRELGLLDDKP